jgi:hypothetical protein
MLHVCCSRAGCAFGCCDAWYESWEFSVIASKCVQLLQPLQGFMLASAVQQQQQQQQPMSDCSGYGQLDD